MNANPRKRLVDTEAMASIVTALKERPSLSITFPTASDAKRIRFEFYSWRKAEQELGGDPTYGAEIRTRMEGTTLIFTTEGDTVLRQALQSTGVEPRGAEGPRISTERPSLQDLIQNLYPPEEKGAQDATPDPET